MLIVNCCWYLFFLALFKPYKNKWNNVVEIAMEVVYIIALVVLAILYINHSFSSLTVKTLAWTSSYLFLAVLVLETIKVFVLK